MVQKRQKQTSSAVIQWVTENQPIRREDLMCFLWPDWLRDVRVECEGRLSILQCSWGAAAPWWWTEIYTDICSIYKQSCNTDPLSETDVSLRSTFLSALDSDNSKTFESQFLFWRPTSRFLFTSTLLPVYISESLTSASISRHSGLKLTCLRWEALETGPGTVFLRSDQTEPNWF